MERKKKKREKSKILFYAKYYITHKFSQRKMEDVLIVERGAVLMHRILHAFTHDNHLALSCAGRSNATLWAPNEGTQAARIPAIHSQRFKRAWHQAPRSSLHHNSVSLVLLLTLLHTRHFLNRTLTLLIWPG